MTEEERLRARIYFLEVAILELLTAETFEETLACIKKFRVLMGIPSQGES